MDEEYSVYGDKILIEMAIEKVLDAIIADYSTNTNITILIPEKHENLELLFEINGDYEDANQGQLDLNQSLSLMLAKLIFELNHIDLETFKSKTAKEFVKITFHN